MPIFKKVFSTIFGSIALSKRTAEKILKKLEQEGKEFEKDLRTKITQISKKTIKEAGLATKEDLKKLEQKIKKMLKK